jgi:hypothetical protein
MFCNIKKFINYLKNKFSIGFNTDSHYCCFVCLALVLPFFILTPFVVKFASAATAYSISNLETGGVLSVKQSLKCNKIVGLESQWFFGEYLDSWDKRLFKRQVGSVVPFFVISPIGEPVISDNPKQGHTNTDESNDDYWIIYFILLLMLFSALYPICCDEYKYWRKRFYPQQLIYFIGIF